MSLRSLQIAKLYNHQFKLLKGGSLPELAVIDVECKFRLMHYADLPSDIPTNEQILASLDEIVKKDKITQA